MMQEQYNEHTAFILTVAAAIIASPQLARHREYGAEDLAKVEQMIIEKSADFTVSLWERIRKTMKTAG